MVRAFWRTQLECFDMPRPLAAQQPEFSRPVEIADIGSEGVSVAIEADASERQALARRFGLVSLEKLTAAATISPVSRSLFRVAGSFEAEVVQSCVVTLDPVPARLVESFSALFGEGGPGLAALVDTREGEDEPEPIEGEAIDLGEAVAQHLSLALDPYPRKPGATLPDEYVPGPDSADSGRVKPFAGLGALKMRRER
jgi:uncharacterized metal-binding protein YceD (DUF177 family)